MGVLDDAIKQHLELKRRHGASEDELREQEAEALGPARRETPASADGGAAEAELTAEAAALEEAAPAEAPPQSAAPAEVAPEEPMPVEEAVPLEAAPEEEPDEVTREESLEAPVRAADPEGPPQQEEDEAEDVLEETPDFLQETPEHDRLWFEQKPPRDFDFDE